MINTKNAKIFSLISAISYTIYAVLLILVFAGTTYSPYFDFDRNSLDLVLTIISAIIFLVIGIAIFKRSRKLLLIVLGVNELYIIVSGIIKFCMVRSFNVWTLFDILIYAVLIAVVILSLKENKVLKQIWFVPAVAYLLKGIAGRAVSVYFEDFDTMSAGMFDVIFVFAGFLFTEMWLKACATPETVKEYATFDPQVVNSVLTSTGAIGGADKIEEYKSLLDSGVISQEEFEAKKKEIFNL